MGFANSSKFLVVNYFAKVGHSQSKFSKLIINSTKQSVVEPQRSQFNCYTFAEFPELMYKFLRSFLSRDSFYCRIYICNFN